MYAQDRLIPKNVLIINSYHEGFQWTKEETDGILNEFKESGDNYSTFIEYMDFKNYPNDENKQNLYNNLKYKYQNKKIDIIIATDDAAFDFSLKNRQELFSNAPVVFCGVNSIGLSNIMSGNGNFTGVLEEIDPEDTIKMALSLNPSLKYIYLLYDNSESGLTTGEICKNKIKIKFRDLNIISMNYLTYDELIKSAKTLEKDSIVFITSYYSDVDNRVLEFKFLSRELSKNSKVPVYHLYDMGLNNGGIGGNMMSGSLQGESACKLAIRILNGEKADDIHFIYQTTNRKVLDYRELIRFNIPLSKVSGDIEVINRPFSFFRTYKTIVISSLTVFAGLVVFLLILLIDIYRIKKMKRNLSENHEELTQIYEELIAAQDELKSQYDELLVSNETIKNNEDQLSYLAYYDILTGLPNKLSLYEKSYCASLSEDSTAALMFIDIDHFKYINDTMGHSYGDKLIKLVGERLVALQRDNTQAYRLSGDEFIIVINDFKSIEDTKAYAKYILESFKQQFEIENSVLNISLSIGIAVYPEHGQNTDELLKHADIAMYMAKHSGRNNYAVYKDQMNIEFTERVNIERNLHTALEKNEFEVYYQPQLDLKTNRIAGFEALLRWNCKELGSIPPDKFIRVAEDNHQIIPVGAWVLDKSCAFIKSMHNRGYSDLYVSVNISMLQLLQSDFSDFVLKTLDKYLLDPKYLELEITETVVMDSYNTVLIQLEKLYESGVKIALDDFGKGYSSLSYLTQLPISTLKIDKTFIDKINSESCNSLLTEYIVDLGKRMGMCVVAEGVETKEQLDYLTKHECNKIQGYYCSRPVPESQVIKLLEEF